MRRASLLRPSLLLPLLRRNAPPLISHTNIPTSQTTPACLPPSSPAISLLSPQPSIFRLFCSSAGPSNIVLIESEEELKTSLKKAQDDNLPAVFYFTAVWCGPCAIADTRDIPGKVIYPLFEELSNKYPHVTTYKVDIDKEGLSDLLSTLKIFSVPTFHFFKNGKKETEIVGADRINLKNTMEELYK